MAVNNYADRDDLLKKLTELDFMAVDLQLFLNTHPTDTEAIALYNKVIKAADIIRAKYEKEYGLRPDPFKIIDALEIRWNQYKSNKNK